MYFFMYDNHVHSCDCLSSAFKLKIQILHCKELGVELTCTQVQYFLIAQQAHYEQRVGATLSKSPQQTVQLLHKSGFMSHLVRCKFPPTV